MNYERENFTPQEAARANPKNLGFLDSPLWEKAMEGFSHRKQNAEGSVSNHPASAGVIDATRASHGPWSFGKGTEKAT